MFLLHDEFKLNGNKFQEVTEEKDLGIVVTNYLKPSVRCSKAAAKAMQVLGIIKKRNFVLTDAEDFRLLFNGFVWASLRILFISLVTLFEKGCLLFRKGSATTG